MPVTRTPESLKRYLPLFDESIDVSAKINDVANQFARAHTRTLDTQAAIAEVENTDTELADAQSAIKRLEDELSAARALADAAKIRLQETHKELYEARHDAFNSLANIRRTLALYATIGRVQGHWGAKVPLGQVATPDGLKSMQVALMEVDLSITDPLALIQSLPHWEGMFKLELTLGNKDYGTDRRGVNNRLLELVNAGKVQGVQLRPDTLVVDKKTAWQDTPLLIVADAEVRNGSESAQGEGV